MYTQGSLHGACFVKSDFYVINRLVFFVLFLQNFLQYLLHLLLGKHSEISLKHLSKIMQFEWLYKYI